jgi:hypothetical protein
VPADRILLDLDATPASGVRAAADGDLLDGDWLGDYFPSGDRTPGGEFLYRFSVLPGDVNQDRSVLADDFSEVKRKFFRSTTSPGLGDSAYLPFDDVDGNGTILAGDFSEVKRRFFTVLPPAVPAAVPRSSIFGSRRIAPARPRDLLAQPPIGLA